jgi:hypothetical protein
MSLSELDLTEMSRADLYDMVEAQASQLLAMKGALEYVRRRIAGGLPVGEPMLKMIDAALSPNRSGGGE